MSVSNKDTLSYRYDRGEINHRPMCVYKFRPNGGRVGMHSLSELTLSPFSGLPLFKNLSTTGLFSRDDSILAASSLLLAGNSLMNRSSETGVASNTTATTAAAAATTTSTSTSAAQLYSQFQNYYHLQENGLFPSSSLILPPPPLPPPTDASTKEGFTSQMPNLAASLLRSRSGSLSRRASEPDLQKFAASEEDASNFRSAAAAAAAAAFAASATVNSNGVLHPNVSDLNLLLSMCLIHPNLLRCFFQL